jgi:hypothetical protein
MKVIVVTLLLIISVKAHSQEEVKLSEIKSYKGKVVKVQGEIFGFKTIIKDSIVAFYLGAPFPKQKLTLILNKSALSESEILPGGFYEGDGAIIIGKVVFFKGRPQITVTEKKHCFLVGGAITPYKLE